MERWLGGGDGILEDGGEWVRIGKRRSGWRGWVWQGDGWSCAEEVDSVDQEPGTFSMRRATPRAGHAG